MPIDAVIKEECVPCRPAKYHPKVLPAVHVPIYTSWSGRFGPSESTRTDSRKTPKLDLLREQHTFRPVRGAIAQRFILISPRFAGSPLPLPGNQPCCGFHHKKVWLMRLRSDIMRSLLGPQLELWHQHCHRAEYCLRLDTGHLVLFE